MDPAVAAADRHAEVRRAAGAWHAAGFIDATTHAAITARHPDDRVRMARGLRILAFIVTVLGAVMLFAFVALATGTDGGIGLAMPGLIASLACAVATEIQRGPRARADAGAEEATALLAIGFFALAAASSVDSPTLAAWLVAAAAALAAARWGGAMPGVVTAVALLVALAQLPVPRLGWIVAAGPLAAGLVVAARSAALAPAQRSACRWAAATFLAAVYLALNPVSLDGGWVEGWQSGPGDRPGVPPALRVAAWLGASALPVGLLVAGARRRDAWLLGLAALMAAATVVTAYTRWPVWAEAYALLLAGLGLAGLAIGLRRWLRAGPGGERGGFTADALWTESNRAGVVQAVVRSMPLAPTPGLAGPAGPERGGRFAGGGATGEF
jgi:hypothetical protein